MYDDNMGEIREITNDKSIVTCDSHFVVPVIVTFSNAVKDGK